MPNKLPQKQITLIGAGLVGSLLAIYLARRGYNVQLFERRTDPRIRQKATGQVGEGRSINLAISTRGIHALQRVQKDSQVLSEAIPMTGRMMHAVNGELTYQAYGQSDKDAINSISRGWLNCYLLDEAEKMPNVEILFDQKIQSVNVEQKSFTLIENTTQKERKIFYDLLIGTDGSASAVRKSMTQQMEFVQTETELSHGYKEFVMQEKSLGQFKMEKNALHIWPRGEFMMIALPNKEGSYTCTLFLANNDPAQINFAQLETPEQVQSFFQTYFADFCELVPDYVEQYFAHPTGKMVTLKSTPWFYQDSVLLMGDASHAIVPFFGQGMNSGFEDVVAFDHLLDHCETWSELFNKFFQARKTNTDAIADMAVENFTEMSAKTADPHFLYQKVIEKKLMEKFPKEYKSRYSMVSFSLIPYRLAYEAGQVQSDILSQITQEYYPQQEIDFDKAYALIQNKLKPVMIKIDQQMSKESPWI